jgi:hypothetical protein
MNSKLLPYFNEIVRGSRLTIFKRQKSQIFRISTLKARREECYRNRAWGKLNEPFIKRRRFNSKMNSFLIKNLPKTPKKRRGYGGF